MTSDFVSYSVVTDMCSGVEYVGLVLIHGYSRSLRGVGVFLA